jgi:hypothetical protein
MASVAAGVARGFGRIASTGLLLAILACSRGPDVSGTYRVETYRENTLTCDEVGHVGGGPSHVRLVAELGGRVLRLDRCDTGPDDCASEGLGSVRFVRGHSHGWSGDDTSARKVGGDCRLQKRSSRLVLADEGRLHVELRQWGEHRQVAVFSGDDECSTETIEAVAADSSCERYEVMDLVAVE